MIRKIIFLLFLPIFLSINSNFLSEKWEDFKSALPLPIQKALFPQLLNGKSQFLRKNGLFYNQNEVNSSFGGPTEDNDQRENWYVMTPYVAEFWCTLSNIGFLYVSWKHKSPELLFAGCASILSHAIPKQWLLYVDKFGVLVGLSKFVREYKAILKQPTLLLPLLSIGILNTLDRYIARQRGETWSHVVWHLGTAAIADYSLTRLKFVP